MSFDAEQEIYGLKYDFDRLLRDLQEIRTLMNQLTKGLEEQRELVGLAIRLLQNSAGES